MTERPRSQTVKQQIAQSGVSAAPLCRHLKALREQQTTPVAPSHAVQPTGDVSAGRQNQSTGPRARPATIQAIADHASITTDQHALSTASKEGESVAASAQAPALINGSQPRGEKTRQLRAVRVEIEGKGECCLGRSHRCCATPLTQLTTSQCDGGHPACKGCSTRKIDCHYDHEPGEGRLAVLKRKFDALEAHSVGAYELLENLRTAPYEHAVRLFAQIRSQDVPFTPQTSGSLKGTTTMMRSQN